MTFDPFLGSFWAQTVGERWEKRTEFHHPRLAGASFASFQPTSFLQLVRRHNHSDGGPFALRGKGTGTSDGSK